MGKRKRKSANRNVAQKTLSNSSDSPTTLENYSQSLIRYAIQARKENQQKARKSLKKVKEDLPVTWQSETEDGLLAVFPEEIWHIIFKNVKQLDVLIRLGKASALFYRIIGATEVLFGTTLPHLCRYLEKQDILSCRLVCPKWRSGVDIFLETHYLLSTSDSTTTPSPKLEMLREFQSSWDFEDDFHFDMYFEGNLFLGRAVLLRNFHKFGNSGHYARIKNWANLCGSEVRHVTLDMNDRRVHASQIYNACATLSENSSQLKSLCLSGGITEKNELKRPPKWDDFQFSQLENLEFSSKCKKMLELQNYLVQVHSAQIKSLKVCYWNALLYNALPWDDLQELVVCEGNAIDVLQSLAKISAPKLRKLGIRLDSNCQNLTPLFIAINNFPNLTHLTITLTDNSPVWSENDLINIPHTVIIINRISNLEVVSKSKEACRDFLVCFPLVRNLVLRCGNQSADLSVFRENDLVCGSDKYSEYLGSPVKKMRQCDEEWFKRREEETRNIVDPNDIDSDGEDYFHMENEEDNTPWSRWRPTSNDESDNENQKFLEPLYYGEFDGRSVGCCSRHYHREDVKPVPPENTLGSQPRFLDLEKFAPDNLTNLKQFYNCIIWKAMPSLERLEIHYASNKLVKEYQFTKNGYLRQGKERKKWQQIHVQKVWEEAQNQRKVEVCKMMAAHRQMPMEILPIAMTKKQLHEQALPIVMPALPKPSIFTCRLVCQNWKTVVDKLFLQDFFTTANLVHAFHVPWDEKVYNRNTKSYESSADYEDYSSYVQENQEKPFFATAVDLKIVSNLDTANRDLQSMLNDLGSRIHFLNICGKRDSYDADELVKICVNVLDKCPNLRKLSLSFEHDIHSNPVKKIYACLQRFRLIPVHPRLESLSLIGPGQSMLREKASFSKSLSQMTFRLLKLYEKLLPEFGKKFPNLKHLGFGACCSGQWMQSLVDHLEAPRLVESLRLRVDSENKFVEQLVTFSNKFPKLKTLELEFFDEFRGLSYESVAFSNPSYISTTVTQIKVAVQNKRYLSLDFLIHFPFLESLSIVYGKGAAPWDFEMKYEGKFGAEYGSSYDVNNDREEENMRNKNYVGEIDDDYIEFVKYFGDEENMWHNSTKILNSNIWTVLRKLKTVELTFAMEDKEKFSTVFNRKRH